MVADTNMETGGLIDAAARILRELIRTPKFRDAVVLVLNSIDPAGARELARVLFWEDTGLFLAMVGALPSLANAGLELAAEAAGQLEALRAPLLREFVARLVEGVDGAAAGEAAGKLVKLGLSLGAGESSFSGSLSSLAEEFRRSFREAAGGLPAPGLDEMVERVAGRAADRESSTHAVVREAGRAMAGSPEFIEHVIRPLLSPALEAMARPPDDESRG